MKKLKFLFIFLFLFSLSFLESEIIHAQTTMGIKISPVRVEDIVDPGQTLQREIKVTNASESPKTLYVFLKDFKADDESGTPKLIAPGSEEGYYLASWIDVSSEGFDFAPGEEKVIPFFINIPENTGPGGYYGGIFFGTEPPNLKQDNEDKGAAMTISQQAGALVLLQVKGDVNEDASIREFNTDKDYYGTPFDVEFTIRIQNDGNVHVKPIGDIRIENMLGKEVDVIKVNDGGGNVLPKSKRKFTEKWAGDFGFGKYKAKLGISYGTPAKLGGQGRQTLYIEKHFWIIPWRIVVPVSISIAITFLLFGIVLRFYKNRVIKKAMQKAGVRNIKMDKGYGPTSPNMGVVFFVVLIVVSVIISALYFLFSIFS